VLKQNKSGGAGEWRFDTDSGAKFDMIAGLLPTCRGVSATIHDSHCNASQGVLLRRNQDRNCHFPETIAGYALQR